MFAEEPARVGLRVHFAGQGFEVQRIVGPAESLRAEVVVLFTKTRTDDAAPQLRQVIHDLHAARIQTHVIECEIWEPSAVVDEVGNIFGQARQHTYYFNVSTGPKTAGMAGTIAAMFWPIHAYYQHVNHKAKTVAGKEDYPLVGRPKLQPTFSTPPMEAPVAQTLDQIVHSGKPLSKRDLIAKMKALGAIHPRVNGKISPQAEHGQADVVLAKLTGWGFVKVDGRGKSMRIYPTEEGKDGARMFRHLLQPRPLPQLLQT